MSPPTFANHSSSFSSGTPLNDSGLFPSDCSLPVTSTVAASGAAVVPVTALDLDFFLNQSTSSSAVSSNSISLLETIEKELLSVDSPVKVQKAAPVEPVPSSADSVFDQFASLAIHSSAGNGNAIDLLK